MSCLILFKLSILVKRWNRYLNHCNVLQILDQESKDEIYVFAAMMHTHLIGTALRVHHFRGDEELPLLAKDDHYDFNFQETRHLPQEVVVKRVCLFAHISSFLNFMKIV